MILKLYIFDRNDFPYNIKMKAVLGKATEMTNNRRIFAKKSEDNFMGIKNSHVITLKFCTHFEKIYVIFIEL